METTDAASELSAALAARDTCDRCVCEEVRSAPLSTELDTAAGASALPPAVVTPDADLSCFANRSMSAAAVRAPGEVEFALLELQLL